MRRIYHMAVCFFLAVAFLHFSACDSNITPFASPDGTDSPSGTPEQATNPPEASSGASPATGQAQNGNITESHIKKELALNLMIDADVTLPAQGLYSTYNASPKIFDSAMLTEILFTKNAGNVSKESRNNPNSFSLNAKDGEKVIANPGAISYERDGYSQEFASLFEEVYSPFSERYAEYQQILKGELGFMSRAEAVQKGLDLIGRLGLACSARSYAVYAMTHDQLASLQSEMMKENDNGQYDRIKPIDNWSSQDDSYCLFFSFTQDNLPVLQNDEPYIQSAQGVDAGRPAMTMITEIIMNPGGIEYLSIQGVLDSDITDKGASQELISLEKAEQCFAQKYNDVILTKPLVVNKIWIEYIPLRRPTQDAPLQIILAPYWCFQTGKTSADRFNAFTGKDLAYEQ